MLCGLLIASQLCGEVSSFILRILHECSCFIEFIKQVGEKR